MIIIIMVCLLVGGGVYYFFLRNETEPVFNNVDNTVSASLLKILDVSVQSTTETSATIKWTTDKLATGSVTIHNSSGTEIGKVQSGSTPALTQSVTVSGLEAGTTYNYTVVSTDADGNEATSAGQLTTRTASDTTPPVISAINANVTESSAIITWTTDEPSTGQVEYGKEGGDTSTTPEETDLNNVHSIALNSLDSGTTYSFTIISKDAAGNQATSTGGHTFTTESSIPIGSNVFDRAPDFTVQNLDGDDVTVKLSDYRGRIVMINFWATWCKPCREEMPYIQAISDNWSSQDLAIFSIAAKDEENLDLVNTFISDNEYNFPVYYDSQGQAQSLYSIDFWPTTFLIDKEGIIQYRQPSSFEDQDAIETLLDTLK
jgi:thiol-disulfide isomerase/thioredoxin